MASLQGTRISMISFLRLVSGACSARLWINCCVARNLLLCVRMLASTVLVSAKQHVFLRCVQRLGATAVLYVLWPAGCDLRLTERINNHAKAGQSVLRASQRLQLHKENKAEICRGAGIYQRFTKKYRSLTCLKKKTKRHKILSDLFIDGQIEERQTLRLTVNQINTTYWYRFFFSGRNPGF